MLDDYIDVSFHGQGNVTRHYPYREGSECTGTELEYCRYEGSRAGQEEATVTLFFARVLFMHFVP